MSQQGCNCGFSLAAAASDHTVLADTSLTACRVDTGHRFSASVAPGPSAFPLSSLQPHIRETLRCSRSGDMSTAHLGQPVHTEAPAGASGPPGLRASPQLTALTLCVVPKALAAIDLQDRPRKDTRAGTHSPQGDHLPLQAGSAMCKAGCLTLAQHPCLEHSACPGCTEHPSSSCRQRCLLHAAHLEAHCSWSGRALRAVLRVWLPAQSPGCLEP